MSDFAFNPDDGPPRLMRFVEHGTLLGSDTVALYDKSNNLLIIDKLHWGALSSIQRHQLLRTHEPCTVIHRRKNECSRESGTRYAAE